MDPQSSRGSFLSSGISAGAAFILFDPQRVRAALARSPRMTSTAALAALISGNRRYLSGKTLHSEHTARREELAAGQHPFAVVLSCSDSRVPPEIVFDQGLGDLFVVRVAGNILSDSGIGSMEYALANFACPVIVVLGHTKCGAVHAAVDYLQSGTKAPGHIQSIVSAIAPAAKSVTNMSGDRYYNTERANAKLVVRDLRTTGPIIGAAVSAGKVRVIPAIYDLHSGQVHVLP